MTIAQCFLGKIGKQAIKQGAKQLLKKQSHWQQCSRKVCLLWMQIVQLIRRRRDALVATSLRRRCAVPCRAQLRVFQID